MPNEFEGLEHQMALIQRDVVPALVFSLGPKFEQNYPASGPHVDNRVFDNKDIEKPWRLWQNAVLLWRNWSAEMKKRRGS